AFLCDGELVAQCLFVITCATIAAGGGFTGFRRNQSQTVASLTASRCRAGRATLGSIELTHPGSTSDTLAPAGILPCHFLDGFGLRATGNLFASGQAQYLTVLHPVDVAVDEGAG